MDKCLKDEKPCPVVPKALVIYESASHPTLFTFSFTLFTSRRAGLVGLQGLEPRTNRL